MTRLSILLLPLIIGCGGVTSEQLKQFQSIEQQFQAASTPSDYEQVASEYQKLIDGGIRNGAVFYNQGNAFTKANQRGQAIAAYRQAQRYLPSDPQLADSLNRAIGARADSQRSIWSYLFFWQDWISYPGKFSLTTWIGTLALLLAVAGIVWPHLRWARRAALCVLLLATAIGASAVFDWYRFDKSLHGVVVEEVISRKGNGDSYEPAFTKPLVPGTEFTVLEQRNQWIRIQVNDQQTNEGWLPANSVATY